MQGRKQQFTFYFIIMSLIAHIILLLLYFYWNKLDSLTKPVPDNQPSYLSSYTYTQPQNAPSYTPTAISPQQSMAKKNMARVEAKETSKISKQKDGIVLKPTKSFFASSLSFLRDVQVKKMSDTKDDEPIYLIGDPNTPPTLLIKLLAKSLTKHFYYPANAAKFGIRGKTLVRFTLHPDGIISDIELVESSRSQELDAAALYATNTAPTVHGIQHLIPQAKSFVVGFVFR